MASPLTDSRAAHAATPSLETLIREAELRVIARDENARRRLDAIGDRIAALPRPRDLLVPVAAAVSGVVALTWFVRRLGRSSRRKPRTAGPANESDRDHRRAGLPWFQLIGLAWPLVPQRWRSRVEPTTASALLAAGLPWFQSAFVRERGEPGPLLQTVGALDLAQFSGTWFEVAHLPTLIEPQCEGQLATVYTLLPSAEQGGEPADEEAALQVAHRCVTPRGYQPISEGIAKVVAGSGGSKLRVSVFPEWWRWLPFAWADEWVIAIDRDYQRALVGDPQRRQLRVLSREPELADAALEEMLAVAREQGFDLERLKFNAPV